MHGRAQIRNSFSAFQPDSSERVRYRVEHGERNSISTSNHVSFCLLYKHNMPLLRRKVYLTHECKNRMHNPRKKVDRISDVRERKRNDILKISLSNLFNFLISPSFSLQRKRKGCTEWMAYTCSGNIHWLFIPLVIDRGIMVQEYMGK